MKDAVCGAADSPYEGVSADAWTRFLNVYEVPENVWEYAPRLFDALEVRFALACPAQFGVAEARDILAEIGREDLDAGEFLNRQYKIGFLNLVDETETQWCLAGYRTYMDVWCVWENDEYRSRFEPAELADIDWKYFHLGFDERARAAREAGVAPSDDEVYTLAETIAWIEEKNAPAYLSYCDCRSFAGDCDLPRETCISYRDGINSYAHRGWARKISVAETLEAVRTFDRAGLMHTLNGTTICNCCGDCCYLSRGRDQLESGPHWPLAHHIVRFDEARCVGCGRCVKRCWRKVFTQGENRKIALDVSRCVGCGLCVNTCRPKALQMEDAEFEPFTASVAEQNRVYTH